MNYQLSIKNLFLVFFLTLIVSVTLFMQRAHALSVESVVEEKENDMSLEEFFEEVVLTYQEVYEPSFLDLDSELEWMMRLLISKDGVLIYNRVFPRLHGIYAKFAAKMEAEKVPFNKSSLLFMEMAHKSNLFSDAELEVIENVILFRVMALTWKKLEKEARKSEKKPSP